MSVFDMTPGARTYPGIPMYTTSYPIGSQFAIVRHPRDFPPSSTKRHRTEPVPSMYENSSNTRFATDPSSARTIELGIQPRRKFKRRNQIVQIGNNKQGRVGKLRCDKCRKIKRKCLYSSINSSCTYCHERGLSPCIKRWGPVREQCEVSRPVPLPAREVIDSGQMLLFQWLYSGHKEPVSKSFQRKAFFEFGQQEIFTFAKQLIPFYSPSINCLSLRYAFLVYIGVITSGGLFTEREKDNTRRARFALSQRSRSQFEEGDVIAAFLLAFSNWVNPNSLQEELGVYLKRFLTILAHVSGGRSGENEHGSLWYFRPIARDLLLHAASRDLAPDAFNRFFQQTIQVLGIPTLAQRAGYLGSELVNNFHLHISYHEMVLMKHLRLFTIDSEGYRAIWLSEIKSDLESMDGAIHHTLLHYVSMATTENASLWAESIELSLVTLLKYYICFLYIALFEASCVSEGFASWSAEKVALDMFYLVSQVVEYNLRVEGSAEITLHGSTWLCVRALVYVIMAFPDDHKNLRLFDGVCVIDALEDICGPALKNAILKYHEYQDSFSALEVFYMVMEWVKTHETSECFVEAYLGIGLTAGLKIYPG